MYLLDTNHCSRLMKGDPAVLRGFEEKGDSPIATSFIVRGELLYMAHRSEQVATNLVRVEAFLAGVDLYLVDQEMTDIYGELKAAIMYHFGPRSKAARRRASLRQLGFDDNDLWIAATALRFGLTVVSADSDFERMREVRAFALESWWSP
jgi:tRNA(fMet)-specific endonuclease VapC